MRQGYLFLIAVLSICTDAIAQNVFLFTIDSCRADRIGVYGHTAGTTPKIDQWAQTGTVFLNAYSTSAWTAPGLASILSGLYPPAHGINNRDAMGSPELPTLPKILASRGYTVPNLNFFTFAPYYRNLGLPEIARDYFGPDEGDELLGWLRERSSENTGEKPFFLWYHTTLVHQPYNPGKKNLPLPDEELQRSEGIRAVMTGAIVPVGSTTFTREDRPALDLLYDAEIRRADALFGKALGILREKGLLQDTIIAVTADHGEELLDHGFVGHASTSLEAKLYEELVRIPMILSWPARVPAGKRIEERVSQVDFLPTLLGLLGVDSPRPVHGIDLFSGAIPERSLFFESVISGNQTIREHEDIWIRAILRGNHKYISSEELYDLESDPAEQANLVDQERELAESMRKELKSWFHRMVAEHHNLFKDTATTYSSDRGLRCPEIFSPENKTTLRYDQHTGAILLDWSGNTQARYLVEYSIGTGAHHIAGVFEVEGNHQILGPLGQELWSSLKAWNPFKIRVSTRTSPPCWSEWIRFEF